jgi:hypothetical protein
MAAENRTLTIKKILDHDIPSHVGIPGNEKADQAPKEALDEDISTTERYPPDDLKKWLTKADSF